MISGLLEMCYQNFNRKFPRSTMPNIRRLRCYQVLTIRNYREAQGRWEPPCANAHMSSMRVGGSLLRGLDLNLFTDTCEFNRDISITSKMNVLGLWKQHASATNGDRLRQNGRQLRKLNMARQMDFVCAWRSMRTFPEIIL